MSFEKGRRALRISDEGGPTMAGGILTRNSNVGDNVPEMFEN